jgi:hypothetical protein
MSTHKYVIEVPAETKPEADAKANALGVLAQKLNPKELAKLAHVVAHEPVAMMIAKKALGL